MASHYDPTRSSVLQVTITHLIYPVTEKVLGQLFDVYGVNDVCLLQQSTHLEAFVEFQSWHEASEARSALHGRCIYDGCCLLDIQHAPLSISVIRLPNSEPVVVDWDQEEVAPLASSSTPSASTPTTPFADITSMAICEVHPAMKGPIVDKALECEVLVALPASREVSALLSEGPERWEHLYISRNLNLLASCWNFSSLELPLYGNDWFMCYNVTDLVVQKNWDPGGMLQSGSAPLAFLRYCCLSGDPCLPEAKLGFQKFIPVCKATYTATHQWDPEILVCVFHVHSVGTLKFAMVRQYSWKVQVINYLLFGVKEWVHDIQRVQPSSVISHAPAVRHEHHIVGIPLQVLVSPAVLELCMGVLNADFNGISRVQSLRPPWLPPAPEVLGNHMKWPAGSSKHMHEIVLWICSRNELMDKCWITCIPKWRFRLSSDQGQGEQFVCSAGKSVEVLCSIIFPSVMMESAHCHSMNVRELFSCNIPWLALPKWGIVRRLRPEAWLLSYHGVVVHTGCRLSHAFKYKIRVRQQKHGGIDYNYLLGWMDARMENACWLLLILSWESPPLILICCVDTAYNCELRGIVNVGAKYNKHIGKDIVLAMMDHEQNTTMFGVSPEFVMLLQGLDLLTVREAQGVYWIALMAVVICVEVLDARVQWDPGGFYSTRPGEHEPNHTDRSWRLRRINARRCRLIIGMIDLSAPWDPGIVAIYESALPVRVKVRRPPCQSGSCKLLQPAHAIAWGQAMFCEGGSVTPGIFPGLHLGDGLLTWGRPNTSSLGDGRIKRWEVNWRRHRSEQNKLRSLPQLVPIPRVRTSSSLAPLSQILCSSQP